MGVFKPYIALPLTASPADAPQMLLHEICHYQGRDHLWAVLRLLCCAVHWFNPLVWLAAAMSRTDMELRCDERVTKNQTPEERKAYAGVLVLAAARRNSPGTPILATGMTMTGKKLKNRVLSIVGENRVIKGLAAAFAVTAAALLVCAFATLDPIGPAVNARAESQAYPWWRAYEAPDLAADLSTEDEFIAYAKTKVGCFPPELSENAVWRAEHVSDSWLVTAADPDGDTLIHGCFHETGLIEYIYDWQLTMSCMPGEEKATPTKEEKAQLIAFAQQCVAQLLPGMAPTDADAWQLVRCEPCDGGLDAQLFCPMGEEYSLTIRIEAGEPRLIYFMCSVNKGNG